MRQTDNTIMELRYKAAESDHLRSASWQDLSLVETESGLYRNSQHTNVVPVPGQSLDGLSTSEATPLISGQ